MGTNRSPEGRFISRGSYIYQSYLRQTKKTSRGSKKQGKLRTEMLGEFRVLWHDFKHILAPESADSLFEYIVRNNK